MASQEYWAIEQGPSKMDLMLALFDGEKMGTRTVTFGISMAGRTLSQVTMIILGVSHEDGSGDSWLIRGRPTNVNNGKPVKCEIVQFYYHTKTRKGSTPTFIVVVP
jgi:hypothetical protein